MVTFSDNKFQIEIELVKCGALENDIVYEEVNDVDDEANGHVGHQHNLTHILQLC